MSVAKGELPITDEPRILYKNIARGLKKSLSAKKKLGQNKWPQKSGKDPKKLGQMTLNRPATALLKLSKNLKN